jgi:hypothetical protein
MSSSAGLARMEEHLESLLHRLIENAPDTLRSRALTLLDARRVLRRLEGLTPDEWEFLEYVFRLTSTRERIALIASIKEGGNRS